MRVAVLGGGITGILTARTLVERGYDVHVFEASERIGGLCRSETIDGYVCDTAGGHVLHARDRAVLDDMTATLGDSVQSRRNTRIYYRGRYVKYPFENGLSDLPDQDNFDCIKGYIDAYVARRGGAGEPENFRDWILWRFGEGISRHFMLPYNEKIWCGDLTDVSSAWCSGRVPEAPLEDVLKASLGMQSEGYTHQLDFHYPRRGGFESLVHAFAAGLEDRIRTSTPVTSVVVGKVGGEQGFEVNGEAFDRIVNTLPLKLLFPTLSPAAPPNVTDALDRLRHLSLSVVFVALKDAELSPFSWVYVPHPEQGPMNRITYLHGYSPENAPDGGASILAEVTSQGGDGSPDLRALEQTVVESLAGMGIVDAGSVAFVRSYFNEFAYPLYDLGSEARIRTVLAWLDSCGVVSLGRFARYAYVNTDQIYTMVRDGLADDFAPLG